MKNEIAQIKELKTKAIINKLKYDDAVKLKTNEMKQILKQKNLSDDNDNDIDKIVDVDIELSDKYNTDVFYDNYSKATNEFITRSIEYIANNPPFKTSVKKINVVKELLTRLKSDPSILIIYREKLFDMCARYEGFF